MNLKAKVKSVSSNISPGVGKRPLIYPLNSARGELLAVGAEQKNAICLTKAGRAHLSEVIGDLKTEEEFDLFQKTISKMRRRFKINPRLVVYDLHPEYLSTRYARGLKIRGLGVQHHHAHIASCLAEHGLKARVIGVAFDGTGYGPDGNIWGGEFLLADLAGFERLGHLAYTPMPGGDAAVREPWRMALSFLYAAYQDKIFDLNLALLQRVGKTKLKVIIKMLKAKINSPLSSGCGRLFDGVAALLGICDKIEYEAQGPIELERLSDKKVNSSYSYRILKEEKMFLLDPRPIIRGIVIALKRGVAAAAIAGKFHNTLAQATAEVCRMIHRESGINKVALSGGVFQNRLLREKLTGLLRKAHFEVYLHRQIPCHDAGVAFGQATIGLTHLKSSAPRRNTGYEIRTTK